MLDVVKLLGSFLAVIVVISLHEFAHAFTAYKCGDPTAKFSGRMTVSPIKHFDPIGMLMMAVTGFGWAKPVPVNPNNFRNYRKGSFWTSAAGIIANILSAFLFYPLLVLVVEFLLPKVAGTYAEYFLSYLFSFLFVYSLTFAFFNLLPLYPLDGFRIVDALNRNNGKVYRFLRQYGYYILLGLILLSMLASYVPYLWYIDVLGYIRYFAVNIFGKPIMMLWDWIFGFIL